MIPEPPPRPDLIGPGVGVPTSVPTTGAPMTGRRGMNGRPPAGWSAWEAVLMFFVANVFIGQVVVAGIVLAFIGLDQLSTTGAAGAPELAATLGADLATVAVIALWLSRRYPGWVDVLGLPAKGQRAKEILYGLVAGPIVYAAVAVVSAVVLSVLLGAISGQDATAPEQIDAASLSTAGKFLTVVVALLVAPVTEELLFRGVLFRAIRDRRGFWLGAVVSSVAFGLVHFVPAPWQDTVLLQVTMVFTGFALASIYERRSNLLVCIVTHMAFNAIGLTFIFALD
jgi:membrane protease YdiL (CAAX protease family)